MDQVKFFKGGLPQILLAYLVPDIPQNNFLSGSPFYLQIAGLQLLSRVSAMGVFVGRINKIIQNIYYADASGSFSETGTTINEHI